MKASHLVFVFSDMLKLGKSKVWTEAFKNMTGYTNLTAEPIKGYFKVLYDWMKEQRTVHKYPIGWTVPPTSSPGSSSPPSPKKPTKKPDSAASQCTISVLLYFTATLAFVLKLY